MVVQLGLRRAFHTTYRCLIQLPQAKSQCRRTYHASKNLSADSFASPQEARIEPAGDSSRFYVPQFTPTPSKELDQLIQECRKYLFIPWSLTRQYRGLLFNFQGGHTQLTTPPGVTITTTAGEEIKLEPLPEKPPLRLHDLFLRIINLMKTTKDFSNLPSILEGYKIAKTPRREYDLEAVARKANAVGQIDEILRCVGLVRRTGASLRMRKLTKEIFLGLHEMGQRSNWEGESLQQALRQAEILATKMEVDDLHQEKPTPENDPIPLRMNPEIAGVLLELSAAQAVNDHGGIDVEGKVASNARKVLALWDNGQWEIVAEDFQHSKSASRNIDWHSRRAKSSETSQGDERSKDQIRLFYPRQKALLRWLPLYNGLHLVEKVVDLDQEVMAQLIERRVKMDGFVLEMLKMVAEDGLANDTRRVLQLYREAGIFPGEGVRKD